MTESVFARNLRRAMRERNIPNAKALSKSLGMHINSCQGWLRDGRIPSSTTLEKIAAFFEVEPEWFKKEMPEFSEILIKIKMGGETLTLLVREVGKAKFSTEMANPPGLELISLIFLNDK